jgi:hypothetical protein
MLRVFVAEDATTISSFRAARTSCSTADVQCPARVAATAITEFITSMMLCPKVSRSCWHPDRNHLFQENDIRLYANDFRFMAFERKARDSDPILSKAAQRGDVSLGQRRTLSRNHVFIVLSLQKSSASRYPGSQIYN